MEGRPKPAYHTLGGHGRGTAARRVPDPDPRFLDARADIGPLCREKHHFEHQIEAQPADIAGNPGVTPWEKGDLTQSLFCDMIAQLFVPHSVLLYQLESWRLYSSFRPTIREEEQRVWSGTIDSRT